MGSEKSLGSRSSIWFLNVDKTHRYRSSKTVVDDSGFLVVSVVVDALGGEEHLSHHLIPAASFVCFRVGHTTRDVSVGFRVSRRSVDVASGLHTTTSDGVTVVGVELRWSDADNLDRDGRPLVGVACLVAAVSVLYGVTVSLGVLNVATGASVWKGWLWEEWIDVR